MDIAASCRTTMETPEALGGFYFPSQPALHEKALADGRLAFDGILNFYGLLSQLPPRPYLTNRIET